MRLTIFFQRVMLAVGLMVLFFANRLAAADIADTAAATAAVAPLPETPAQKAERMKWWNDARFGMFIHWGVYSVPAGEWNGNTNYAEWFLEETHMPVSQYEKYANQFNPTNFDALTWVKAAKAAGVKYIVITSKHHDGFAMYPTKLSDWSISRTPFKRDPLAELAAACKKEGIKFCLYYTVMDWHSSDWGVRRPWNDVAAKDGPPDMDRFENYMKGQLKEIITSYGPLGLLWFDGNWEKPWTAKRGQEIYNYVRTLQPSIIVNNRVGKPENTPGGGFAKTGEIGDYGTPEQTIPPTGFGPGVYWESCMTMNDHWGYNKADQNFKSAQTLVRNLIDCSSKGGNYLLNVGPTSAGIIPAPEVERLKEIGDWMKLNSVAIYGTSASPFKRLPWGRCTQKADGKNTILYLHVFDWPTDGKLVVPGLKNQIVDAYLLKPNWIGWHSHLKTAGGNDGVTISLPATAPDAISSTIVLKVKGAAEVDQAAIHQKADGSFELKAADADLTGGLQYEADSAKDCIGYWTSPKDSPSWTFNVTKPRRFQVTAEVAAQGEANFKVIVGDQSLSGTAPNTGDYTQFQKVGLEGVLQVSAPGKVTLTVKAVSSGWTPVNLRSITLTPVAR
ncbi:MAG TPA: alpha-L-fucosidase [Verrucomicrobiae bacterium]|jgi:alpha-L-fucosidase